MESKKFARQCDITKKGMNEGFYVNDEIYIKNEVDLINWLRERNFITADGSVANDFNDEDLKEWAYNDEIYYFTEWDDEEDYQYQIIDGVLMEIEI